MDQKKKHAIPLSNVGFLVQTLNLRDLTLFNVDCKCGNSPFYKRASAANFVSTDTGAFRIEKNSLCLS